jgi:hypothetical protein
VSDDGIPVTRQLEQFHSHGVQADDPELAVPPVNVDIAQPQEFAPIIFENDRVEYLKIWRQDGFKILNHTGRIGRFKGDKRSFLKRNPRAPGRKKNPQEESDKPFHSFTVF